MEPTREDIFMISGSSRELRWQLLRSGASMTLGGDDLVELFISEGQGKPYRSRIVLSFFDAATGIVSTTLDVTVVPITRTVKMWWYEVWHSSIATPTNRHPHIVGELVVTPTIRV